jgi:hypothetical protein
MSDRDKPNPTKATDVNHALVAAVSLLGASLGVSAASPADAATVNVHTQVQTPKLNLQSPKGVKTYSNSSKQWKSQSIQDKDFQSNQGNQLQSNQEKH